MLDPVMDHLTIRPGRDAEARACRMLLPGMFPPGQLAPAFWVAWQGGTFAGALVLGEVPLPESGAWLVDAHVIPPCRRRGIGRALMQAAIRRAAGQAPALRAAPRVPEDSAAALFLRALGFEVRLRILHFETDTAAFLSDMTARRRHLEHRGRVPPDARVVRLRDVPAAEVAALVAAHFPARAPEILRRMDPSVPGGLDVDNSVALLVGGSVRAALLFDWKDGVPVIDVRVVDRSLGGGWANVLILEAATRNGYEAGSQRFRFFADEGVTDTMRLARRAGAALIRTELIMDRAL